MGGDRGGCCVGRFVLMIRLNNNDLGKKKKRRVESREMNDNGRYAIKIVVVVVVL